MTKTLSTGNRTGKTKTYETTPHCPNCGGEVSSLEVQCPHCGANKPAQYDDVKALAATKGRELKGEELERVKSGGGNCAFCGKFTFNYDHEKNQFCCPGCGVGTGEKTDYEMAGGEQTHHTPDPVPARAYRTEPVEEGMPLKTKLTIAGIGGIFLIFFIWLIVSLTTTHDVTGTVSSVSWVISAHQEEEVLKSGEGFDLPYAATKTSSDRVSTITKKTL